MMGMLLIVVGTRPEVVKMTPIIRQLDRQGESFIFVHTGQHYDYNLSLAFIEELGLHKPDYSLEVRERSREGQTGRMMTTVGGVIKKEKPSLVLIEGDTNTVLATALASLKQNAPVGHVEAGLRSYDFRMPEEHNRRIVDQASSYLFAPTEKAKENVVRENVWGKIYVTGNTVIDAVSQHVPLAKKKSRIMEEVKFEEYALATAHRMENVDDPRVLRNFVEAFMQSPIPIVYPIHPRAKKRLRQHNMWRKVTSSENIQILPPVGYFDFLMLMKNCKLILTDSGGIQEEATAPSIRKPVLVIRICTERPEAVEAGFAKVVGTEREKILTAVTEILMEKVKLPIKSPFGDGHAGEKVVRIVRKKLD